MNRLVAFLTPVFAALAGFVCEWVAKNFPGVPALDKGQLTAVFVTGATSASGAALHWLTGWQKHEARTHEAVTQVLPAPDAGDAGAP